jgi:alpha-tubulin suppressor-like RCC1 family protein
VTILPVAVTLEPGDTITLSAIPRDSLGQPVVARKVVWGTSSAAIVRIDSLGHAQAIAPGSATITATVDAVPGEAMIAVVTRTGETRFLDVSAGGHHACAIGLPPIVLCWGRNKDGQLGNGTLVTSGQPAAVRIEGTIVDVATGARHTCVLAETGEALCWGWNSTGQLGAHLGEDKRLAEPVAVETTEAFTRITAGSAHNCALATDMSAVCWGSDEIGQLGNAGGGNSAITRVAGDLRYTDLDAGHAHTCGVTDGRDVRCWGWNAFGQLGSETSAFECAPYVPCTPFPQRVTGLPAAVLVRTGFAFTCALVTDGRVFCWGLGVNGQLGNGGLDSSADPRGVGGGHRFVFLDAGAAHACALTVEGEAWCWGLNRNGQLGDGLREDSPLPVRATVTAGAITRISAGEAHTCAVTTDQRMLCWGSSADGRLGPFAR